MQASLVFGSGISLAVGITGVRVRRNREISRFSITNKILQMKEASDAKTRICLFSDYDCVQIKTVT